jgi:hypothetical protein
MIGRCRAAALFPVSFPTRTGQEDRLISYYLSKCILGCFIRRNLSSCPKSSQNHGAATGFDEKHPPLDCVDHGAGRYVSDLLANARLLTPALIISPR